MIMRFKYSLSILVITFIFIFATTISTFGAVDLCVPKKHVNDHADIIDIKTEDTLNTFLSELEMKTGTQIVIITARTTDRLPVEESSIDNANNWKLDRFEQSNGVQIVISKNDRNFSIEVGSGLEKLLTNKFCEEIGTALFTPNFKNDNYNEGIFQGSVAIINKIANDNGSTITGVPKRIRLPRRKSLGISYLPMLFLLILPVLLGGRRRCRRHWAGMTFFMRMPFMFGGFGGHRGGGAYACDGFGGFGGGLGGGDSSCGW